MADFNPFLQNSNPNATPAKAPIKPKSVKSSAFSNRREDDSELAENFNLKTVNSSSPAWDNIINPNKEVGLTRKDIGDPEAHNKVMRGIIITVASVIVLILLGVGYFYVKNTLDEKNRIIEQNSNAAISKNVNPEQKSVEKSNIQLKNAVLDSKKVDNDAPKGLVSARVNDDKTFIVDANDSDSYKLSIPNLTDFKPVKQACELKNVATNCYLGSGTLDNKNGFKIWAVRDAKQSSLMFSLVDVQKVPENGAAVAFTKKIPYNGKNYSGLFIVNKNQTGFAVLSEDANTINNITNGQNRFNIQQVAKK